VRYRRCTAGHKVHADFDRLAQRWLPGFPRVFAPMGFRFGPVIPVFVRCESFTRQAGRDFPAIATTRAQPTRPERVPARTAATHALRANPAAAAQRTPGAMRTINIRLAHRSATTGRRRRCVALVTRHAVELPLGFLVQLELRQVDRTDLLDHTRNVRTPSQNLVETGLHRVGEAG
jgi:hypothetical protein